MSHVYPFKYDFGCIVNSNVLCPTLLLIQTTQQEWGWEVFQSIEKYLKTQYGYGSLKNVNNENSVEDRMESFFMAETLKYLYLLFDPDSEIDILKKVCLVFLYHVYSQCLAFISLTFTH